MPLSVRPQEHGTKMMFILGSLIGVGLGLYLRRPPSTVMSRVVQLICELRKLEHLPDLTEDERNTVDACKQILRKDVR